MVTLLSIAMTLYCEAASEGEIGMRAVASVIYNEASRTGKDYTAVCQNPRRYSCWRDIDAFQIDETSGAWKTARKLARQMVIREFRPDGTWTHYYNPRLANPNWADLMINVSEIGNHRFGVLED